MVNLHVMIRHGILSLLLMGGASGAVPLAEKDHLQFADGLYARGMYDLAVDEYRDFLETYPNSSSADVATFRLAESYRQLPNLLEAEKAYRTVFNKYPESQYRHAAGCKRADLFIETGQYDAAIELFDIVLTENPPPDVRATCLYFKGEALLKSGQTDAALTELQQVVENHPESPFQAYALLKIGNIWTREKEDVAQGLEFFERAADEAMTDRIKAEAVFQMADLHYRREDYEKSAEQYRRLLTEFPEDERALDAGLQSAWAAYRAGFYAEALEHTQGALTATDGVEGSSRSAADARAEWLYLKANCQRQLLQNAEAAATYDELLETHPNSVFGNAARYEQAVALFKMGEYAKAIAEASELQAEGRLGKDIYWLLAEAHAALDRTQEAIQYYRLLTRNYPDSDVACDARFRLGHHLQSLGNNKEAVAQYHLVANDFPENPLAPRALFAAAVCQLREDAHAEAARDLQRLIEQYPDSMLREKALYQQAMCEIRLERDAEALQSLRKLLTEFPDTDTVVDARYWMGMLLLRSDRLEDAEGAFRACLELAPREELKRNALFYLAVAMQRQGQIEEAVAQFVPLLSTPARDKFTPSLLAWLAEHLLERGELEEASTAASLLLHATDDARWRQIGWGLKGQSELARGNHAVAQDAFRKVLESDERTRFAGQAALQLGEMALEAEDVERAESYLNQAASLADEETAASVRARAYNGLGRAASAQNEVARAARYFMSVAVLYDDADLVPSSLERAIECFRELGDEASAQRATQELLERYPDSEPARKIAASSADAAAD